MTPSTTLSLYLNFLNLFLTCCGIVMSYVSSLVLNISILYLLVVMKSRSIAQIELRVQPTAEHPRPFGVPIQGTFFYKVV